MTKINCNWVTCKFNSRKDIGMGVCQAEEVDFQQEESEVVDECEYCGRRNIVYFEDQLMCMTYEPAKR